MAPQTSTISRGVEVDMDANLSPCLARPTYTTLQSPYSNTNVQLPQCLHRLENSDSIDAKAEMTELVRLATPIIITYVLELLPAVVSIALVGRMDSPHTKEYVDGATMSNMFMNLSGVAVGFGLATAMDTLCSQACGAGRIKNLGVYFQSGVIVMAVALVPVFLANWFTEDLLLLMDQHEEVSRLAGRFSRISLPGLPFLFVYELLKKVLQAQNIVRPMVYIAVFSNVVNLVLGIYLTWYTSLGYDGAAIARSIASVALLGGVAPYFVWRPTMLTSWWSEWHLRRAMRNTREFLKLGIPGMFMIMLEWWSYEVIAVAVGLLPDPVVALSVHSVLVNISNVTFNFFMGVAVATSIRVGIYLGADMPSHARLAARLGMLLSFIIGSVLVAIIAVSRHSLPSVFINDATAASLAAHALLFLIPFQLVDAVNCVMQGIFRGTGRQTFAAIVNLFAYYAVGLPLGILLAFLCDMGVEGCWNGLTGGIVTAILASAIRLGRTDWQLLVVAAKDRTALEHESQFLV